MLRGGYMGTSWRSCELEGRLQSGCDQLLQVEMVWFGGYAGRQAPALSCVPRGLGQVTEAVGASFSSSVKSD